MAEPPALTDEYMWESAPPLVAAAFGAPSAFASGYDEIGALASVTWDRTGFSMVPFELGSGTSVTVTTLPGGEWAAAELEATSSGTPVAIVGAEHATMTTNGEGSVVCFSTRGAAMCVESEDLGPEQLLDGVRAFVASLPGA